MRSIVAIASGKGGTGKTTLALNLAQVNESLTLLDCDVEEPNLHLFLPEAKLLESSVITLPTPQVDAGKCTACAICSDFCRFNALAMLDSRLLIFEELCHACGGCTLVCPESALCETPRRIGVIEKLHHGSTTLLQGRLDIGAIAGPPLIKALKKRIPAHGQVLLDAPPGTSCPMVATLQGVDYAVLVTEPTPFGLHDLQLAIAVTRELELPFGVVLNRDDSRDNQVVRYCRQEAIDLLARIPADRAIAEAYSRGEPLVNLSPEYRKLFTDISARIFACTRKGV